MKNKLYAALVVSFLLVASPGFAQTPQSTTTRMDSLFAGYNSQSPGLAVAVIRDGKIVFEKGYGMADLENNIPITPQTVFHVASVSKQFTAFSIYLLAGEGKISLEDDVRKYIPELPDYGKTIRIRHLLAHTSGLRDQWAILTLAGWRMDDVITTEQLLKLVTRQKGTNFPTGSAFSYSNTGYMLLAEIIHRVSGKTFRDYTNEMIFKPLKMNSTQFYDDHQQIVKNRADSYEKVNETYQHKRLNYANVGATSLLTTVEDLSKWVLNFENPVVGNPKLIAAFNSPSYLDNGQKIVYTVLDGDTIYHAKGQLLRHYRGVDMINHGGHDAGFRAFLARFPDQRFAYITLSNDESYNVLKNGMAITELYLGKELTAKRNINSTSQNTSIKNTASYRADLKKFEGTYYNDELSTNYTIKVAGDKLMLTHIRLSDVELNRNGETKFSGTGEQIFAFEIEFIINNSQQLSGFFISNFGAKNIRFNKVEDQH